LNIATGEEVDVDSRVAREFSGDFEAGNLGRSRGGKAGGRGESRLELHIDWDCVGEDLVDSEVIDGEMLAGWWRVRG
jgi:hypothetical protein